MAGKYAHVLDKLPRHLGTEPEYQDKVDAIKTQVLAVAQPNEIPITPERVWQRLADLNQRSIELHQLMLRAGGGKRQASVLARTYRDLRKIKDEIEAQLSNVNLLIIAHEQLIADQYEVEGMASIKLDDLVGGSVTAQPEPHAVVEDREKHRLWCLKNGFEKQMFLSWQTTNAMVKENLLAGEAPPEGVVAKQHVKIVFRK